MSYDPQSTDDIDFEIGAFGDRFKRALNKITEYTIVKPSEKIGGMIGGKAGREIGEKIGKFTAGVTKFGVGAGALGAAPMLLPAMTPAAALLLRRKGKLGFGGRLGLGGSLGLGGGLGLRGGIHLPGFSVHAGANCDPRLAAHVAGLLTAHLGGSLGKIDARIKLAEFQRQATWEHNKLMADAEFRKAVLGGIARLAMNGNACCARTIKVLGGL